MHALCAVVSTPKLEYLGTTSYLKRPTTRLETFNGLIGGLGEVRKLIKEINVLIALVLVVGYLVMWIVVDLMFGSCLDSSRVGSWGCSGFRS